MTYKFRNFHIPDYMMGGLERWIEHGIEPGHFLIAVLSNDLKEAVGRADDENIANLPAYMGYLYNEAPIGSWGNPSVMRTWPALLKARREEGNG